MAAGSNPSIRPAVSYALLRRSGAGAIVAAFAALGLVGPAGAAGTESPTAPPLSRLPACQACHGVDGVATVDGAPNLAGQRAAYLEAQLANFRSRERKHELMNAIAAQLSDAEIEALAKYWSEQPAGGTLAADARKAAAVASDVTFPADFPANFVVYRTSEDPESRTITKDWANRAALDAARAGQPLPLAAAIVVETLAAKSDAGKLVAEKPVSYVVFAARAGWGERIPALLRNGDWQFGAFAPERGAQRLKNQATCLACHKPQAAKSFLFTYDELAAHAKTSAK